MAKHIFLCFFILLALSIQAQDKDFSKAVLIDESEIKDPIFRKLHEKGIANLINLSTPNILFYNWNAKSHSVKFSSSNKNPEKPSDVLIYLYPYGSFNTDPSLEITTDTTGKTTAVYFLLNSEMGYWCKHIDAVTSKVLRNDNIEVQMSRTKRLNVSDYEKEFGGDPARMRRMNSSQFEKVVKALKEKYKEEIEKEYVGEFFTEVAISRLAANILTGSQNLFKVILPSESVGKKVKKITFNGGLKDNLVKKDNYKVLVKKSIGDYHYYDDIASVYVDEIGENESKASTLLFGDKDLGTAMANKEELLMASEKNVSLINRLNKHDNDKTVNIAIKKDCLFCLAELEQKLYECPVFNIIERNAPELKYFFELSKNEKFIDYSVENLQGKQLGYELLIAENDKYFQVVETATNKNIASIKKNYKWLTRKYDDGSGFPKDIDYSVLDITLSNIQRLLTAYNSEAFKIEWIQTLKEKKDEIEKIAVYHPAGMDRYMEYNFYTTLTEEVDGEKIERKNKIGRGKIGKSLSPNISELNIKDGEKEIFKARMNKEKIIIEVSDKSSI